jgi:hypothetical protein
LRVNRRGMLLGLVLALALVGVLVVMQPFSKKDERVGQVITNPKESAISGLCAARDSLAEGNRIRTYDLFYSKAHVSLHLLAAELDDGSVEGRGASSKLRIAKSRVEQEINIPNGTQLPALLDSLVQETSGEPVAETCR